MTHSRRTMVIGAFILTVLLSQASFARQLLLGDPESTVKLASAKIWRGIVNIATGSGEIIRQPIVCTMEDGGAGVPVGLFSGVFMSIVRTGAGIVEVITFPWALDDTIGYDSIMNPDYVWQRAD